MQLLEPLQPHTPNQSKTNVAIRLLIKSLVFSIVPALAERPTNERNEQPNKIVGRAFEVVLNRVYECEQVCMMEMLARLYGVCGMGRKSVQSWITYSLGQVRFYMKRL